MKKFSNLISIIVLGIITIISFLIIFDYIHGPYYGNATSFYENLGK